MVLGGRPPGRVGRRRDFSLTRSPLSSGSRGPRRFRKLCGLPEGRHLAAQAGLLQRRRHLESTECPRSRHGQTVAPRRARADRAVRVREDVAVQARGVALPAAAVPALGAVPAARAVPAVLVVPARVEAAVKPAVDGAAAVRSDRPDRARVAMPAAAVGAGAGRVRGEHRVHRLETVARPGPAAGPRRSHGPDQRRRQGGPVGVAHRAATAKSVAIVRAARPQRRERAGPPAATSDPSAGPDAHRHVAPARPGRRARGAATPSKKNANSPCRPGPKGGGTWPGAAHAR